MTKKKFTLTVFIIGLVFALKIAMDVGLSFFAAPILAKKTKIPFELSYVSVNYLTGGINVSNFRVGGVNPESKKYLLSVANIYVDLSLLKLMTGNIVIEDVRITNPVFHVDINKKNHMPAVAWIEDLHKQEPKRTVASAGNKAPPSIVIENFRLHGGEIMVNDYSFKNQSMENLAIKDIELSLGEFNLKNPKLSEFLLSGEIQNKGAFTVAGKADLASPKISAQLKGKIENVQLVDFNPYAERHGNVRVTSGVFNMESDIAIKKNELNSSHHVKAHDVKAQILTGKLGEVGSAVGTALSIFYQVPKIASVKHEKNYDFTFLVKGSLDNPQFDFTELMAKEMANTMNQLKQIINIEKPAEILNDLKDKGLDTIFGK